MTGSITPESEFPQALQSVQTDEVNQGNSCATLFSKKNKDEPGSMTGSITPESEFPQALQSVQTDEVNQGNSCATLFSKKKQGRTWVYDRVDHSEVGISVRVPAWRRQPLRTKGT